jgi:hypothetical protein
VVVAVRAHQHVEQLDEADLRQRGREAAVKVCGAGVELVSSHTQADTRLFPKFHESHPEECAHQTVCIRPSAVWGVSAHRADIVLPSS